MIVDLATRAAIDLIERGLVPDKLTRRAISRLCTARLRSLDHGDASANERALQGFVAAMRAGPIAPVPEAANAQHYEVPAELYSFMLGARRKYSCCYWPQGITTLDAAEDASLATTCEYAEIADGQEILELGCGWGALSLWIAEKYPNCRITAVSNSQSQRRYIQQQAAARGFADRVTIKTCDMNEFTIARQFDRVVSVEMFEHMRNYERLLARIAGWLTPVGKLFVHVFCHRRFAYPFETDGPGNWMGRYFFTGGIMPSEDLIPRFAADRWSVRQWNWNGIHYRRTADAWLARLDENREAVMPILATTYGQRDARRWLARWRLLMLAGAELFGYDEGRQWYVSHSLLAK